MVVAAFATVFVCSIFVAVAHAAIPSLTATDAVIGQTIHATAELSESPTASGEISFEVFGPSDPTCIGPALTPAPTSAAVSGNGSYVSGEFTPPSAGVYHWSAKYPGDLENPAADSICSASSTVGKASPGLTGVAGAGAVGTAIHDEATVTGGFSPTGEVSFALYGPGDTTCSNSPLQTFTAPLQGVVAVSADFTTPQAGEFRWTASYPGDANNEPTNTTCNAANQTSVVSKALPNLTGAATSAANVGLPINDSVTLAGGFAATGQLVFRAYGPGDQTCTGTPKYVSTVAVSGDATYSPLGFTPTQAGRYLWTVGYAGDANNAPTGFACGTDKQASAVGTIPVVLAATATGGTVGTPISAAATIAEGAIPTGQISFKAFPPTDVNCAGTAAFSSTVSVSGNGSFRSASFVPTRVGAYRWTVSYSGDVNHDATTVVCGKASSSVSQAKPSITGTVAPSLPVGTPFQDTVTLQGGYAPGGTITFRIYGPVASGCAKPIFTNVVAVTGNGTYRSDPFVALRTGRYGFVATYSGDAGNQGVSEPCDTVGQAVQVQKRKPVVKPRARLIGGKRISIRARLSGGVSPSGAVNFRLYAPGNKRCLGKPVFSGGISVKANGDYSLAEYFATKPGIYRLRVGYSGDKRNRPFATSCGAAQSIRVR